MYQDFCNNTGICYKRIYTTSLTMYIDDIVVNEMKFN